MSQLRSALPHDWQRKTNELLALADEMKAEGFHHLPAHAKAMERALSAAHAYANANWQGCTLQALGAFWEIYCGYLDKHPEYDTEYKGINLNVD